MKQAPNPIHNPPEKKESRAGVLIYSVTQGAPQWSPRDYASFADQGYIKNAIVYRCIRLIAEAALSIPLLVYDENDEPVEKHPFYDLISRPNPFQGQAELLDALYSFLLIAGNTYLETVLLGKAPKELYTLRPDRMTIKLDPKGRPSKYIHKVGHDEIVYDVPRDGKQREILHIKLFHPTNDLFGLSAMEPAAYSIDVYTAAGAYNKSLLDNGARPSGALVVVGDKEGDASLTEEQFSRLKTELEDRYQGTQNAGRPMLLEGGLDWKPMGIAPVDLEFTQGKAQAAREIALSFGVPPQLLGIPGDNTYSNLKEANVAFYRQCVLPFMTRVCQSLSVFFTPSYGDGFRVWFDINEVSGLVQEREDTWSRINAATTLTTNEKREALGYAEVEGGDDVLIQSSLVPLIMEEEPEVDDEETGLDDQPRGGLGEGEDENEEGGEDNPPDPSETGEGTKGR